MYNKKNKNGDFLLSVILHNKINENDDKIIVTNLTPSSDLKIKYPNFIIKATIGG